MSVKAYNKESFQIIKGAFDKIGKNLEIHGSWRQELKMYKKSL